MGKAFAPTADVMQHEANCADATDADIRSGQAIPTTEMQTCKTEDDEKRLHRKWTREVGYHKCSMHIRGI